MQIASKLRKNTINNTGRQQVGYTEVDPRTWRNTGQRQCACSLLTWHMAATAHFSCDMNKLVSYATRLPCTVGLCAVESKAGCTTHSSCSTGRKQSARLLFMTPRVRGLSAKANYTARQESGKTLEQRLEHLPVTVFRILQKTYSFINKIHWVAVWVVTDPVWTWRQREKSPPTRNEVPSIQPIHSH